MDDKLDITELSVGGTAREIESAELILHTVGLSWGAEIVTEDPELIGHRSGDSLELEMQTAEGLITGEAKVLRVMGEGLKSKIEVFGASDLMNGEELFRAQYL